MAWRLAASLTVLLEEVNAVAPARSRVSDGTIGDPAHAARVSDHNPNAAGVVRAVDITDDPAGGCDGTVLAENVRLLGLAGHPALGAGAYVIHDGRIASATDDGAPWDWEPYGGSNPHTQHVHISVATAAAGYDSRAPWGVLEGDDMFEPTDRDVLTGLAADVAELTKKVDRLDQARANTYRRDQKLAKAIRDARAALAKQDNANAAAILAAIEDLDDGTDA
ncbi:hypothetical protein [Nocardioides sp.]|uniref:hypothetical protein n=1 Tax=Nocardioides sp. TaxID=35761 RepID=UPI0035124D98